MQLVMFDIDGTLVDSKNFDGPLYAQAVQTVLGVGVDTTWSKYQHVTDSGILEEILSGCDPAMCNDRIRAEVKRTFLSLLDDYPLANAGAIGEVPGARRLIDELLAADGVRVAVATGGWRESALLKLAAIGVDPDAIPIATAADAISRTRIMELAAMRALDDLPVAHTTYFGDGEWDRRASEALGYRFIGVGRKVEHRPRFDDLSDKGAILKQLEVLS